MPNLRATRATAKVERLELYYLYTIYIESIYKRMYICTFNFKKAFQSFHNDGTPWESKAKGGTLSLNKNVPLCSMEL